MTEPLVARLREDSVYLSGRSIDRGCVDCGIAANLADEAADLIVRLQAENEALRRERDEARAYAQEATRTITGLTVGGSEYFGKRIGDMYTADLPFCATHIRERFDAAHKAKCEAALEKRAREAAEAKAARLEEALVAQRAFILHWTDDVNGGLKPTLGSLRSALDAVSAALEA